MLPNHRQVYRAPGWVKPMLGLVAAPATAHPTGGHIVHIVVVDVGLLRALQRLREGADELITELHGRDLERILERPVIIGGVLALTGPEQELDQLHLDPGHQLRVASALLAFGLAGALDARGRRWGDAALGGPYPPGGTRRSRADRRGLGHEAGPQRGQVVFRRCRFGWRGVNRARGGDRRLIARYGLPLLRNRHRRHREAGRRYRPRRRWRPGSPWLGRRLRVHHLWGRPLGWHWRVGLGRGVAGRPRRGGWVAGVV